MNELVKMENMSLSQAQDQVQVIQEVLKGIMIKKTHYDTIPGCGDKPVLLKPGAEKILSVFQIGCKLHVEDLGDGYDHRYRVKCEGFYIPTGNVIGEGIGECSTSEKKYAWRIAICDEEFEHEKESRKQIYWSKDYKTKQPVSKKQVRSNPSDMANTVLKMAKKRAMIDLCLSATACSDLFTQDIDEEMFSEHKKDASISTPQPANQNNNQPKQNSGCISEKQANRLKAIVGSSKYDIQYVIEWLSIIHNFKSIEEIQWKQYDEICKIVEAGAIK